MYTRYADIGTVTRRRALITRLLVSCALALGLAACGDGLSADAVCGDGVCSSSETAASCAEDCGCGNGVLNPGESCDGSDLGDATCLSEAQQGGTLRCNSDCTFDVSECTLPVCGNGIVEEGETCDGDDLGDRTCESIGYAGGQLGCTADCVYDVAECCTDGCVAEDEASCVGDSLRACTMQASGCLAVEATDCTETGDVCDDSAEPAMCVCVDRCSEVGETRCEGAAIEGCAMSEDGCLDWEEIDDCSTDGQICAVAPGGPACVADAGAEDCNDPYPLSPGDNVVAWAAIDADYLTSAPSCNTTGDLTGPDLVLSYTAPEDGFISYTMEKPSSARQVVVVSSEACGTVTPELSCQSEYTETTMSDELAVTGGETYYFYVRDTDSGSDPLDNPLIFSLDEALCSSMNVTVDNLSPGDGTSVPDLTPIFTADFTYPVDPSAGVITVTGDMGTDLSFDLATSPSQIALINGDKTLIIDPGIIFPDGETLDVSWTGLTDATCGTTITPPTWSFQVTGPPCVPGTEGMVGNTISRIPTSISFITEYYVAADDDPDGYVYVGGTSDLYRVPKAGGTTEDVEAAVPLTLSNLGYGMIIVGDEIFTLESKTSGTTGHLWRLSTSGGSTWSLQDYMSLPTAANDDLRGATHYDGRIYLTTQESTDGTEIWSVPVGGLSPLQVATLEASVAGEANCTGLALDDNYFYLACSTDDRVVRVHRTSLDTDLITDQYILSSVNNELHAHDFDGDGSADALYLSSYYEEVYYVCDPAGSAPFWVDVLASFGSGSSSYGLGFDPVGNTLWKYDDGTEEFVKIE